MASILKVNTIQDATNSNTALSIDSDGVVSQSANPILKIQTASNYTSGGSDSDHYIQNLTDVQINRGGFTTASTNGGRITFPKTGYYDWKMLTFANISSGNIRAYQFDIYKNGSFFVHYNYHAISYQGSGTTHGNFTLFDTFNLNANDYFEFIYRIYDNNTNVSIAHRMHFHWIP